MKTDSGLILITGASGRIGSRTAELLALDGHKLRLMTRTPERAPKLPSAEIVRGDFANPASLRDAFSGVNAALVISASGQPGARALLHKKAFEAAARAGAVHVVYLSMQGAAPNSKYLYSRDHSMSEYFLAATGVPHTVLRDSFYMEMFLNMFSRKDKVESEGVIRGPARRGRAAFISREDVACTAAAALLTRAGGVHDVTGPEALSLADVATRLSAVTGCNLRFEDEPANATRDRLSKLNLRRWEVDLSVGWFEAIAAGELRHVSDTVLSFTGTAPLTLESYFRRFPRLLRDLSPQVNA
jgi:uncharacterized protein YbjT (DUF2867 family)